MADYIETQNLSRVPTVMTDKPSSTGTLVTLIIVVGVIVIGALYVWGERVAETRTALPATEPQ